VWVKSNYTT